MDAQTFQAYCNQTAASFHTRKDISSHLSLASVGEWGECCEVLKKIGEGKYNTSESEKLMLLELGDLFFYLSFYPAFTLPSNIPARHNYTLQDFIDSITYELSLLNMAKSSHTNYVRFAILLEQFIIHLNKTYGWALERDDILQANVDKLTERYGLTR